VRLCLQLSVIWGERCEITRWVHSDTERTKVGLSATFEHCFAPSKAVTIVANQVLKGLAGSGCSYHSETEAKY